MDTKVMTPKQMAENDLKDYFGNINDLIECGEIWIDGFVVGYEKAKKTVTNCNPLEISDEEIEKFASDFYGNNGSESIFIIGAKWYREQLKQRQCNKQQ
jgi:hypothetical protein